MELTNAMRNQVEEKVARLPHLYDGIQTCDVTFSTDGGQFHVELHATGKRKSVFVAKAETDDMYGSLDLAVHKMEEQLRRHKDKVRDRQGPGHEETMNPES
jgi:putative sigma-54 modulation protein